MQIRTVQGVVVRNGTTRSGQHYAVLWSPEVNHSFILKNNISEAEWISASPTTWREYDVNLTLTRGPEGIETEAYNLRRPLNENKNPCTKATDAYTDIHYPRVLRVFTKDENTIKFSDKFSIAHASDRLINGLFLKNVEINPSDLRELRKYGIEIFTGSAVLKIITKHSDQIAWTIRHYIHEGKELSFHGYCSKLGHLRHGRGGSLCSKEKAVVPPDPLIAIKERSRPSRFSLNKDSANSTITNQSIVCAVPSTSLDTIRQSVHLSTPMSSGMHLRKAAPTMERHSEQERDKFGFIIPPSTENTCLPWTDPHADFCVEKCDEIINAINQDITLGEETYNMLGCLVHIGEDHLILFTPLENVWKILVRKEQFFDSSFLKNNKLFIGEWMSLNARPKIFDSNDAIVSPKYSHVSVSKPDYVDIKSVVPKWKQRIENNKLQFLIITDLSNKDNYKCVSNGKEDYYYVLSENGAVAIVPQHRLSPLLYSIEPVRYVQFWANRGKFMFNFCLHLFEETPIEEIDSDNKIIRYHKSVYPSQRNNKVQVLKTYPNLKSSLNILLHSRFHEILKDTDLWEDYYTVSTYIQTKLN